VLTQSDINSELDELDREEFYRLKKASWITIFGEDTGANSYQVANKKQRDTAALDEELKKKKDQNGETAGSEQAPAEPADLLKSVEDEDVIF